MLIDGVYPLEEHAAGQSMGTNANGTYPSQANQFQSGSGREDSGGYFSGRPLINGTTVNGIRSPNEADVHSPTSSEEEFAGYAARYRQLDDISTIGSLPLHHEPESMEREDLEDDLYGATPPHRQNGHRSPPIHDGATAAVNGVYPVDDVAPVHGGPAVHDTAPVRGGAPVNGVAPINGIAFLRGTAAVNGIAPTDGIAPVGGLSRGDEVSTEDSSSLRPRLPSPLPPLYSSIMAGLPPSLQGILSPHDDGPSPATPLPNGHPDPDLPAPLAPRPAATRHQATMSAPPAHGMPRPPVPLAAGLRRLRGDYESYMPAVRRWLEREMEEGFADLLTDDWGAERERRGEESEDGGDGGAGVGA
ncbi:MAG: hypothetical protein M1832_002197 [Thelocarpon impressellum]|nr:MAG: hypothetical protein M1832_002197 [Thelocarpon impressellum]